MIKEGSMLKEIVTMLVTLPSRQTISLICVRSFEFLMIEFLDGLPEFFLFLLSLDH